MPEPYSPSTDEHVSPQTEQPAVPTRASELSIQQLYTFKQVMESGGYAAAARVSHLSVPSVWQHIQAIERAYGTQLFQREGRQVKPTKTAKRLYQEIDEILARLQSTFDVIRPSNEHDSIRIVSGVRMFMEDLAEPVAKFRKRFNIPLTLLHGNNRRAEELLLSGDADLALTLAPGFQQESEKIAYEPAYEVEFIAACKKNHPLAASGQADAEISLSALVENDLVVSLPGTHGRDALDQALHAEGLKANFVVETDNSGFTLHCAARGIGVGILAGRPSGELTRRLHVRSLRKQLGIRQIVFMWRRGRLLTEPMLDLIEQIKLQGSSSE
ncbi:MAG TPA: LysR family transcriptional regulator [Planctomycetaceae bacterium]|nr:LysR family transcriptional regulator [Planctomycetaceae bacterium]